MNLHLESREGDALAFFLDGDLQFDTRDERLYHENLALPALTLARPRRVLICGGGDGLALREVLRFPGVEAVELVDWSAETLAHARTTFAPYNENALADPRVQVHTGDAWAFLEARPEQRWDTILCDFTVPRSISEARVYTREWYARLRTALTERGVLAVNACSPQRVPEAFACLVHTIAAAGLAPVPYRACIPSFFEQGYGIWGFVLAGRSRLRRRDLRRLACPVPTHQTDLTRLWHAAAFSAADRQRFAQAPVHTLAQDSYVRLLLNPGQAAAPRGPETLFEQLLRAIPLLHPHHTRTMVESMAEQVVGTIDALDLKRLTGELLARAHRLPPHLRAELESLRSHLTRPIPRLEIWATRLFAALLLILTLANIVAPDNAYGKGSSGLGHASVSRGLGSFGRGSFGRGASGFSAAGRSTGSFGKSPGGFSSTRRLTGGSFSAGGIKPGSFAPDAPISGNGFRHSWRQQTPTDVFGQTYRTRTFIYYSHAHYYGGGGQPIANGNPERQPARFVADDDMLVLENGDVVLTLADTAYLVVSQGTVTLHQEGSPEPLLDLYADPTLFENIAARLQDQRTAVETEIARREEWLSWVGWTGAILPSVRGDNEEVASLKELQRRLSLAVEQIGQPASQPAPALPATDLPDAIELCGNVGLLRDGRLAVLTSDAQWHYYQPGAVPAALKPVFSAITAKLTKEFASDIKEWQDELQSRATEKTSLETDLRDYTALATQNGMDYEVDYGDESISAREALDRTNKDLADNTKATEEANQEIARLQRQSLSLAALRL